MEQGTHIKKRNHLNNTQEVSTLKLVKVEALVDQSQQDMVIGSEKAGLQIFKWFTNSAISRREILKTFCWDFKMTQS